MSVGSNACSLTATAASGTAKLTISGTTGSYYVFRSSTGATGLFQGFCYAGSTTTASFTDAGVAASSGFTPLTLPYTSDVGIDSASNLWRIRTRSNNTLEIVSASVSDTPVWGANKTTNAAIAGYGVALYVSASNNIDFWYCVPGSAGGVNIQTVNYNGSVISSASTVYSASPQPFPTMIYLSAPTASLLFFTDSSASTTLVKYVAKNVTWQAPVTWDLGPVDMGIKYWLANNLIPSQPNAYSTINAVAVGSDVLLTFYANTPLGRGSRGLYTLFVSNITPTTAFWRNLNAIHTQTSAFAGTGRQIFLSHPTINIINGTYWILTIQSSIFAGNSIQKLVALYSADGKHWVDRLILAGTDFTTATYTFSDLAYSKLIVSGNRLFLITHDEIFRTQATSVLGATNSAMTVDATVDTERWSFSRAPAGQAAQANTLIVNNNQQYNASSILRRGARLVRKVGYVTTSGAELLTLATEIISRIEQSTRIVGDKIENLLTITTRDYIDKLSKWAADTFVEFFSGYHVAIGATSFAINNSTPVTHLSLIHI